MTEAVWEIVFVGSVVVAAGAWMTLRRLEHNSEREKRRELERLQKELDARSS